MSGYEYAEERDGGDYVAGSRVSLASAIFAFRDGASPETLRQNFPSLSLGQVYGAIAFHLDHPAEQRRAIDTGIQQDLEDFERGRVHGPFSTAKEAS